ncbi:MAG TPA: NADH-quinone oxidoreductase subunit E, partial [Hyphomonas atlantica]|nr:NADH-quinone oxidoreductase subunit E [Hyphomonas atlantica]
KASEGQNAASAEKPAAVEVPTDQRDDLKRISGIGPKNEDALNALGIFTFQQIA